MEQKDTKDMTASELMRLAANGYDGSSGIVMADLANFMGLGRSARHSESLYKLADKIDAELAQARNESLLQGAQVWAKANGWSGFRDGEDFGAWLDRCFLPRPRFEDGEPVQFEDKTDKLNGVEKFILTISCGGSCQMQDADGNMLNVFPGGFVKRPDTEVLGADGLPIKAGETVYTIDSEWFDTPLEVLSVESLSVKVSLPSGKGWTMFRADRLTHTPPDTQERIDADKGKSGTEYWGCIGLLCGDCPAEIDGKRPSDRYGVLNCSTAQGMDIARRQADLDARKGGE